MKIYIGHSGSFDFKTELYLPIRNSDLNTNHQIILPHEKTDEPFSSKDFFKSCDLLIADVSYPSTGLGIELGWANNIGCPIVCTYKKGSKISNAIKTVTNKFFEYSSEEELISIIKTVINEVEE